MDVRATQIAFALLFATLENAGVIAEQLARVYAAWQRGLSDEERAKLQNEHDHAIADLDQYVKDQGLID